MYVDASTAIWYSLSLDSCITGGTKSVCNRLTINCWQLVSDDFV